MQKLDATLLRLLEEYRDSLLDAGKAAAPSAQVRVLMRVTGDLPRVVAQGFKVLSQYGPVVAGAAALANLEKIATMSNVVHIEEKSFILCSPTSVPIAAPLSTMACATSLAVASPLRSPNWPSIRWSLDG